MPGLYCQHPGWPSCKSFSTIADNPHTHTYTHTHVRPQLSGLGVCAFLPLRDDGVCVLVTIWTLDVVYAHVDVDSHSCGHWLRTVRHEMTDYWVQWSLRVGVCKWRNMQCCRLKWKCVRVPWTVDNLRREAGHEQLWNCRPELLAQRKQLEWSVSMRDEWTGQEVTEGNGKKK